MGVLIALFLYVPSTKQVVRLAGDNSLNEVLACAKAREQKAVLYGLWAGFVQGGRLRDDLGYGSEGRILKKPIDCAKIARADPR